MGYKYKYFITSGKIIIVTLLHVHCIEFWTIHQEMSRLDESKNLKEFMVCKTPLIILWRKGKFSSCCLFRAISGLSRSRLRFRACVARTPRVLRSSLDSTLYFLSEPLTSSLIKTFCYLISRITHEYLRRGFNSEIRKTKRIALISLKGFHQVK